MQKTDSEMLAVVSAAIESVLKMDKYAACRTWMNMWRNMDEYAVKGENSPTFGQQSLRMFTRRGNSRRPYVWATEFENVHTTWEFSETEITVQGTKYSCTESFYHAQKPVPFDESEWLTCSVAAMRVGLRQKFLHSKQSKEILDLLVSSHPYLLRSLKRDYFWGFHPEHCGHNFDISSRYVSQVTRRNPGGSRGQSRSHFTKRCF